MSQNNKSTYLKYWNDNIENWGTLYLEHSHGHEKLNASPWFDWFYKKTLYKYEAKLMKERYRLTMEFIDQYIEPGMCFNDIGCGIGLFTIQALKKGAKVNAIDFSEMALKATQKRVEQFAGEYKDNVSYHHLNAEQDKLPPSDVALAMGVTPYIKKIDTFYENILSSTDIFYCLLVDSEHYLNKLRKVFPFLNVRELLFYSKNEINHLIEKNHCELVSRVAFGTGFLDVCKKVSSA